MNFQENLVRVRKARGLSQEDLAARVQVSRQAVSKWETGDAMPDLSKLLVLADTLEVSLDALCGREKNAPDATASGGLLEETPDAPPRRRSWLPPALCGFLAACLLSGSVWAWSQRNVEPGEEARAESSLPDTFSVLGGSFAGAGEEQLTYSFTPSIAGEDYTYEITFAGLGADAPKIFQAPYSGGICTDTVTLSPLWSYTVIVTVSDGISTRACVLAESLDFDETGASWSSPR